MPDQKPQAKIPVKKADGTTVFLTMEEFRAYKAQGGTSKKLSPGTVEVIDIAPVQIPSVPREAVLPKVATEPAPLEIVKAEVDLPRVLGSQELTTTTPITNIFVEEARASAPEVEPVLAPKQAPKEVSLPSIPVSIPKPLEEDIEPILAADFLPEKEAPLPQEPEEKKQTWNALDHASLLDEELDTPSESAPITSASGDNAQAILDIVKKQLPLPIPKDVEGRFDSLLLSRIRDIRTEIDFERYAKSPKDQGGLGFDEDQVRLVLAVLAAAQKISGKTLSVIPSVAEESATKQQIATSLSAPRNGSINAPSATSLSLGRKATPINITPALSNPNAKPVGKVPLPPEEYSFHPPQKDGSVSPKKTMMQDVVGSQVDRRTMGPVDEIQHFSLTDFRRLAPKVDNAREIFKSKFISLQEESYVLFLDARDAWLKSPLYKIYQSVVLSALDTHTPISAVLAGQQNGLSPEEFNALVQINHFLG